MKKIKTSLLLLLSFVLLFSSCKQAEVRPVSNVTHPEWSKNAVMYEINIRQFTPEGTFTAAMNRLENIKETGASILWVMPIYPIGVEARKGLLGSYYSIQDYKAVNPEFGSFEDFKQFVVRAHELGFKVILDWVANHTSRDAVWMSNKDWYVLDSLGSPVAPFDWSDVAKLNYENEDMRSAMIDAMKFWITDAGVDGYRCDVAAEVPVDFWDRATKELRVVNDDIFMLAEAESPELQINSFNSYYAWHFHHILNKIAKGEFNADTLREYMNVSYKRFPINTIPLNFTSNHDENSWNGTEFERLGEYAKSMAALTFMMPGMPLIYNGQEIGFNRRLEFFVKDSIDWQNGDYSYTELYKNLSELRRNNPALNTPLMGSMELLCNDKPSQVFALQYVRDSNSVFGIFNLSKDSIEVNIKGIESGKYHKFMDSLSVGFKNSANIDLLPYEYKIFYKK